MDWWPPRMDRASIREHTPSSRLGSLPARDESLGRKEAAGDVLALPRAVRVRQVEAPWHRPGNTPPLTHSGSSLEIGGRSSLVEIARLGCIVRRCIGSICQKIRHGSGICLVGGKGTPPACVGLWGEHQLASHPTQPQLPNEQFRKSALVASTGIESKCPRELRARKFGCSCWFDRCDQKLPCRAS